MNDGLPARLAWAVELVAPQPGERILEIGCGRGAAVRAACARGASLTAIDRSATAIETAVARNIDLVKSGRADFHHMELETADLPEAVCHKAFAVNVNLFWTKGAAGLAQVRRLLAPDGRLWAVYQPPGESQIPAIVAKLKAAFVESRFEFELRQAGPLVAAVGRPV